MAISWGAARETSTNGVRIGVDLTYTVSGATATIVFELWLWTKRDSYGSAASYTRTGNVWSGGGTFSYSHSTSGVDWSTNNRTRIGRWTTTRTLQYGSTQTITAGGSVTNSTLGGNMPSGSTSHSRSITLPARPFELPNAPTNVQRSRSSDTRHTVTWTRNPSAARPYVSQRVQRQTYVGGGSWGSWTTRATVSGTATSWTDTGTAANNVYRWRVVAVNTAGTRASAASDEIRTSPAAPTNVVATKLSSGDIRVTYVRRSPYSSSGVEHHVQDNPGGSGWVNVGVVSGSGAFVHQSPDPAVTHRYRVKTVSTHALSPMLESAWSGASNVVQLSAPPSAPTNLGPGSPWDATEDRVLSWRFVSTDSSDQEAFQVRHRVAGGSWTTVPRVDSAESRWTLPANTYANGDDIEWQVRTWGAHPDPSPYSASNLQSPVARPTVAINSPEQDEVVDLSSVLVSWGFDQAQGGVQSAWRLSLEAGGTVVQERSGSGAATSYQLANLADDTEYTLTLRVQSGGLWSEPDTVSFTVDYLSPQAPVISVDWDVAVGAASVSFDQPVWDEGHAEPAFHQLWRAIDDGPWLLVADEIPIGSTVSDPIPAMGDGHVNYYRAVTVSVLPSTADSEVVTLTVPSTGRGGTQGWVYLNGGPGMSMVCRVRANADRADNEGVAHTVRHFAGRPDPVAYFGTARSLTWDVSARIAPDFDGASTRDELVALQAAGTPICYRDPTGARWFGVMGPISSSWRSILGEVSFSFTRVDVVEGLDVVQRLPSELEPAL